MTAPDCPNPLLSHFRWEEADFLNYTFSFSLKGNLHQQHLETIPVKFNDFFEICYYRSHSEEGAPHCSTIASPAS